MGHWVVLPTFYPAPKSTPSMSLSDIKVIQRRLPAYVLLAILITTETMTPGIQKLSLADKQLGTVRNTGG